MFRHLHDRLRATAVVLLIALPTGLPAQTLGGACTGGGSGSLRSGSADIVYSISGTADGAQLDAAVLVRGSAVWRELAPADSNPALMRSEGTPRLIGGATVGPLWVQYERGRGILWLGGDSVAVGEANVVLVDVDSAGRPNVTGTSRVAPRLPPNVSPCRPPETPEEAFAFEAALLRVVRADPAARAFMDR